MNSAVGTRWYRHSLCPYPHGDDNLVKGTDVTNDLFNYDYKKYYQ